MEKPNDSTSSRLTVNAAAEQFAGPLTPQEHEDATERVETAESDASPSPEERPEETEQSADEATTEEPELFAVAGPDGKELKVTLEELRGGYLRQSDYTRKTQAAAELRKAAEAEAQSAREAREQYAAELGQVRKALEALMPPEPDWDTLRKEDPSEYAIKRLEWNDRKEAIAALRAKEHEVAQLQEADRAKQMQSKAAEEHQKLLESVPDWKDQTKAKADLEAMVAHAKSYGFTDAELSQVYDHRTVLLLRDAMRYRDLMAKKPDAERKVQKVKAATPGGLKTPEKNADYKRALEQLGKTGRKDDAVLAFMSRSAPREG